MVAQFTLWKVLPQKMRITQAVTPDPLLWDLYSARSMAISGQQDLILTRHLHDGTEQEMVSLRGHGMPLHVDHPPDDSRAWLAFEWKSKTWQHWVRVPFTAGRHWSEDEAKRFAVDPPDDPPPPRRDNWQGEVTTWLIGPKTTYRMYGVPRKVDGPTMAGDSGVRHDDIPSVIEIIRDGKIVDKWPIGALGLRDDGKPIDVRYEPEGLSVIIIDEVVYLLVGIAVGPLGRQRQHLYTTPIGPAPKLEPAESAKDT